jgi:hypothetical protein
MAMVQDELGNWYDDGTAAPSVDDDFSPTYPNVTAQVLPSVDDDFSPTYPEVKPAVMPSIDDDFSPTYPITGGGIGGRSVVGGGGGITDYINSLDLTTAGGIAGALAGATGAFTNKPQKAYEGKIPQYTAVRNMVNAPPTGPGYRPGQGGVNWGGNVSYVPRGSVPNSVGTPMNPSGVNPATNPKTPNSTISNLAKVAGTTGLATLLSKVLSGGKGGTTDGIKSILDKITGGTTTGGKATTAGTGTAANTGIAGAVNKAVTGAGGASTATKAGTPAGGAGGAGGSGVPRGIGGGPAITTQVEDDGTTAGINETISDMQGTAYDDDGNLMPGYELDENGDPVYVGDSDSTTIFNPDGTIGDNTEDSEDDSEDDTTFNWDEDMGSDIDLGEEDEYFDFGSGDDYELNLDDYDYARGGIINMAKGRYLQGNTDGMADKIPARIGQKQPAALSHGEFVVPADVVSHLGNGNSDAGAKKLYQMMDRIRVARTGNKEQGRQINPDKFMPGGLAQAYANGGRVRGFAGPEGSAVGATGLGSAVGAGITGTETGPNSWAGDYMSDLLGKTQALTESPYQQYMGPSTAGASNLQNKVFQGLGNVAFPGNLGQSFSSMGGGQQYGATSAAGGLPPGAMAMPAYKGPSPSNVNDLMFGAPAATADRPMGMPMEDTGAPTPYDTTGVTPPPGMGFMGPTGTPSQGGIAGLTPPPPQGSQQPSNVAQQYMNPYLQSVLNPQLDELRRQNDITNMKANAGLTSAGAFGGGRQAIMNAENNRNLMQEQNKTVGAGYANAYDKAQQQFNTEQGQSRSLAELMAQQGGTERGIESEGIAADKAAFEAARENPYKMLQFQQSMLNGLPVSATSYNIAQPTKLQEIMAGAAGGAKAVGANNKTVADLLAQLGL